MGVWIDGGISDKADFHSNFWGRSVYNDAVDVGGFARQKIIWETAPRVEAIATRVEAIATRVLRVSSQVVHDLVFEGADRQVVHILQRVPDLGPGSGDHECGDEMCVPS